MGGSEAAHGPHFQFNGLQVHGASLLRYVRPAPPEIPDYATHLFPLFSKKRCCSFYPTFSPLSRRGKTLLFITLWERSGFVVFLGSNHVW